MQIEPIVLDLIQNLYEAASDSARWPEFLKPFMDAVGANATALVHHSFRDLTANLAFSVGLDPVWQVRYEQHYAATNVWVLNAPELFVPGNVTVGQQAIDEVELRKTEFFNDFLSPQAFLHSFGGTILRDATSCAYLSALRPVGANPFGADEMGLLRVLMPHLDSALKIHQKIAGLENRYHSALELLHRFSHGVLLLDREGGLLFMNRVAEEILATGDGIAWTRSGFAVSNAAASARLRKLLGEAMKTACSEGIDFGGVTTIPRPSLRRPYEVLVAPLPPASRFAVKSEPGVMILLSDLDQQQFPDVEVVQSLFKLTAAEARIAVTLVRGKSIEEAAEELGVTINTARTQLKSVLSKTGARRQSELVRMLMASLARVVR